MIFVDQEEIIEISADLPGRTHGGINIEFPSVRERREDTRKHTVLNPVRHMKLCTDALLFPCDLSYICYVLLCPFREIRERLCKDFDLIIRSVGIFHDKQRTGLAAAVDILCHLLDRLDDIP